MNTIFIGFEPAEEVAYHTLVSSILNNTSRPVNIVALDKRNLSYCHKRVHDPKQSNSFTYVRFLVPWLSDYTGWSLFMDCDMILRTDINDIFALADDNFDVMCVCHPEYDSVVERKYLDTVQYNYPRKNWSSVMLFNNAKCRELNPLYIDYATPKELHRMEWAEKIGELPKVYNHLVGEQVHNSDAKIVHFTLGTPCWKRFSMCEFSDEWRMHHDRVNYYLEESLDETG